MFKEVFLILGYEYFRNTLTHPQRIMLLGVLSMFLPFYMCASVLTLLFIRILWKHEVKELYIETTNAWYLIAFSILSAIVSLFYKNYLGALISAGFIIFITLMLYYRKHLTKPFFETLTNLILYMSAFAAIYGLIEYVSILSKFDLNRIEIIVFNTPENRINSVFFNANYYAMMIEFFVGIAFYKTLNIFQNKIGTDELKKLFTIGIITSLNLFCLYISGCRTAWPAILISGAIMLLLSHHRKLFISIAGIGGAGIVYLTFNPQKIPRVNNIIAYLGVRMKIWKAAINCIKDHPLFGEGPLTYFHIYKQYHGHPTQHAHNIYIDPILSYGIIGLGLLVPYIYDVLKNIIRLYKKHLDDNLVALIFGCLTMIFIHGFLDLTIFFVQTGFLFLIIISSFGIYTNEIKA